MFKKSVIGVSLIVVCSLACAAQPDTFYAGADVGRTHVSEFSQGDTSFGIFAGYNFGKNIAAEIGFRRLADFEYRSGSYRERAHADQLSLSVVGSIPFGERISAYGRLGLNSLEVGSSSGSFSVKDSEIKLLYGFGVKYDFDSTLFGRVEVQKPVNESTNLSIGIGFQF